MGNREDLQLILEQKLGSRNVYFQPPESLKIDYPAIIYSHKKYDKVYANNRKYLQKNKYSVTLIYNDPELEDVISNLLEMEYCSHDAHSVSNNLNHDMFTLYF